MTNDGETGTTTRLINRGELPDRTYRQLLRLAQITLAWDERLRRQDPASLISETWLRLRRYPPPGGLWTCRRQFFGYAKRVMFQVCVDWLRARQGRPKVRPPDPVRWFYREPSNLDVVERALAELERELGWRRARVVWLRFFENLTEVQTAARLTVSRRTVQEDWHFARVWLRQWLDREADLGPPPVA